MSRRPAVDRSQPPPPGELRPFRFPPFTAAELDNGLRVLTARAPRVPLVSLEMLAPAGGQLDPPELPGLASFHGALLDEGTARHTALEIAADIEKLGGSLGSGAGWNMAFVETGHLAEHLPAGLALLAEIVRSPDFPAGEIDRLRQQRQAEILRRLGQPASLADDALAAAIYGGTVYGQPLLGTEASLERMGREDFRAFYRRHVHPNGSTVIGVGDLDPDDLTARVERAFGDWPRGPEPVASVIEPTSLAGNEVHVVDRPEAAQTQLVLGHVGVPRKHPDYHALMLLNTIFGGKFTSRINLNLRERHGFTYGAQSYFTRRRGPGPFVVKAAVATDVVGTAVRELLSELRRIREEPVSHEDLLETQDYLVGVFPYTLQTIGDLVRRLEALAVYGLADTYYEEFPQVLRQLSRDDVLAAARRHLRPEHLAIVAVGPEKDLRPQLEELGPVKVTPAPSPR